VLDREQGSREPLAIKKQSSKYAMPKPEGNRDKTKGAKFAPEECRLIQIMMEDAKKIVPWKTDTDFIRWAVLTGMWQVVEDIKSKRVTNQYAQVMATIDMLRTQDDARRHMGLLERLRKTVEENERMGGQATIPGILRAFAKLIGDMEPGFWVNKLRKEFQRDYGKRLNEDRISPRPRDAQKDEGEDDE
jgi:hypothetical protein